MTTETSREALAAMARVLPAKRRIVYFELRRSGPQGSTARELKRWLDIASHADEHSEKRLTELERAGLVERAGTRPCSVTGMRAIVWRVTDEAKPTKKKPARAKLEAVLAEAFDWLDNHGAAGAGSDDEPGFVELMKMIRDVLPTNEGTE